jgi:hypothetical protein
VPRLAGDPTDDELIAFAESLLSELGDQLREPAVLAESVREHREVWVMLFRVARETQGAGQADA